jgi:hypothetical protein
MKELIAESLMENKMRKEALKKQLDFSGLNKIINNKTARTKKVN